MMASITFHAQYFDGTPVTGLYITLESLQGSGNFYKGFTDYEGRLTTWFSISALDLP